MIAESRRREYQSRQAASLRNEPHSNFLSNKPRPHYIKSAASDVKAEEKNPVVDPLAFDPTRSNKNLPAIQPSALKIDVRAAERIRT